MNLSKIWWFVKFFFFSLFMCINIVFAVMQSMILVHELVHYGQSPQLIGGICLDLDNSNDVAGFAYFKDRCTLDDINNSILKYPGLAERQSYFLEGVALALYPLFMIWVSLRWADTIKNQDKEWRKI